MKKTVLIIVIIILLGTGFYFMKGLKKSSTPSNQTNSSSNQIIPSVNETIPPSGNPGAITTPEQQVNPPVTSTPNPKPTITPRPQPINTESKITIQNFAFNPNGLNIKAGTTVVWTNKDSAPHQINSATFNSKILNTGDSFSFKFNQKGIFDYICGIHPSMQGKITVE